MTEVVDQLLRSLSALRLELPEPVWQDHCDSVAAVISELDGAHQNGGVPEIPFTITGWCLVVGSDEVHRYQPACANQATCVRLFVSSDDMAWARGG